MIDRRLIAGGAGVQSQSIDPLRCAIRPLDGAVCLSVRGDLDLPSLPSFLGCLNKATEGAADVIVELSGLRYVDSSGINALLAAHKRAGPRGQRIVLAAVSQFMRRLLDVINLEQALPVFATVDDALENLRERRPPD